MVSNVALRELKGKFDRKTGQDWFRATLGDTNGIIHEPGQSGFVRVRYIQADGLSLPPVVRLVGAVPIMPGIGVIIARDYDGQYAVVSCDFSALEAQGINPAIMNPLDRSQHHTPTTLIPPLMSHPIATPVTASLKVAVRAFIYLASGGTWHHFAGAQVDFTGNVPSAGNHRLAGIFLKTDDTLEVVYSTTQNELDPLTVTGDIQECQAGASAGSFPVWFWRLSNGQTSVTNKDSFLDARQLINNQASAGSGTVTSVALTMPTEFSVTGSPITAAGTLAVTKANQNANLAYAGPSSGAAAAPTFRSLVNDDLPNASFKTLVARTVLGASAANIDLQNIPATYDTLLLIVELRSDRAGQLTDNIYIRFNNDSTAANYDSLSRAENTGSTTLLQRIGATATGIEIQFGATGATATSGHQSLLSILIPAYTKSARPRRTIHDGYLNATANGGGAQNLLTGGALWENVSDAINRITLLPVNGANFIAGSSYALYAIGDD